jgi:hypothetical protein
MTILIWTIVDLLDMRFDELALMILDSMRYDAHPFDSICLAWLRLIARSLLVHRCLACLI